MTKIITDEGIFEVIEDVDELIHKHDAMVQKEINELKAVIEADAEISVLEREKREYISKHIIPHLRSFGNVYMPYKKVVRYGGKRSLLSELRERGYDCEMAVLDGASILPDGRRGRKELDAILTLKR